jgi:hypothetical protein
VVESWSLAAEEGRSGEIVEAEMRPGALNSGRCLRVHQELIRVYLATLLHKWSYEPTDKSLEADRDAIVQIRSRQQN